MACDAVVPRCPPPRPEGAEGRAARSREKAPQPPTWAGRLPSAGRPGPPRRAPAPSCSISARTRPARLRLGRGRGGAEHGAGMRGGVGDGAPPRAPPGGRGGREAGASRAIRPFPMDWTRGSGPRNWARGSGWGGRAEAPPFREHEARSRGGGSQGWGGGREPRQKAVRREGGGAALGATPRYLYKLLLRVDSGVPPGGVLVAGAGPLRGAARRAAEEGLSGGQVGFSLFGGAGLGWAWGIFPSQNFFSPFCGTSSFHFVVSFCQSCQRNQDCDCCGMFRKLPSLGPMLTNRLAGVAPVAVNAVQRLGPSRPSTRTAQTP